jgi:cytochrome c553
MSVRTSIAKITTISILLGFFNSAAIAAGDVAAGQAQAITCAACHGQDGATAIAPNYPSLAGQNEVYLTRQLKMFQSGERNVALMTAQLIGKTEKDLADLGAYYASLPAKHSESKGIEEDVYAAERIYKGGVIAKGVAACAACHGPNGAGNAQAGFPAISGQSPGSTIEQLTDYREGRRGAGNAYGNMMRGVAAGLSDGQIAILADYISGLH